MKRIFVVGDILLDKYDYCSERHNPESSAACYNVESIDYKLGGAGNVAANLAHLGNKTTLIGLIGKDDSGSMVKKILNDFNITAKIVEDKNVRTIIKERTLDINESKYLFRKDTEHEYSFDSNKLIESINKIPKSSLIIVSDYNKGTITKEIMEKLKEKSDKIIIDPKPANSFIYSDTFLITPNYIEACEMSGKKEINEIGEELVKKFNSNILLKIGKDGVSYFGINGERFDFASSAIKVVDVTGAGDTVIATFAHFFNSEKSIKESIMLANKAAGISVEHSGCYQVNLDELSH